MLLKIHQVLRLKSVLNVWHHHHHENAGKTTHQKVSAQERKEIRCSEIMKASQVRESWLGQWGTSTLFILINRPLWTTQKYPDSLPWHQQHPGQHESWNILNLSYFLRHLVGKSSRKLWWKGYYVAVWLSHNGTLSLSNCVRSNFVAFIE